MRSKLNIPKNKDQFENVSFVNDMTPHQLKVCIKRLFENFHDLANILDSTDPKIAQIIDSILSGETWKDKDLNERMRYMYHNKNTIAYDSVTNAFSVMTPNGDITESNALTKNELLALFKTISKRK